MKTNILIIGISLFLFSCTTNTNNGEDLMSELQKLPAHEKISACKELQLTAEIFTKEDPQKIYNSCLNLIIQKGGFNEDLCLEFSDSIAHLKKEECLSKIAVDKNDISFCNFSEKNECIGLAGIKILQKYGDLDCNPITNKEKKIFCTNLKIGIKYSLLNSFDEITNLDEQLMIKKEGLSLSYFGNIQNLCTSFEKEIQNMGEKWRENSYNNCIYAYMEVNNELRPENCQKLRLEKINTANIANQDFCIIAAITEGKGTLNDCFLANEPDKCISIITYINEQEGRKIDCNILKDLAKVNLCISATTEVLQKHFSAKKIYNSCKIKGNISFNTGEKIYHTPNCEYYSNTIINSSYGERWFCSEQEAIKAGWRKAKNCF